MLMVLKTLFTAVAGTVPIILVWVTGQERRLYPAILISLAIVAGQGITIYHVVDLAAVIVVGMVAYLSLDQRKNEKKRRM